MDEHGRLPAQCAPTGSKESDLFQLINELGSAVESVSISADEIEILLFGMSKKGKTADSHPPNGIQDKLRYIAYVVTDARERLNDIQRRIGNE